MTSLGHNQFKSEIIWFRQSVAPSGDLRALAKQTSDSQFRLMALLTQTIIYQRVVPRKQGIIDVVDQLFPRRRDVDISIFIGGLI